MRSKPYVDTEGKISIGIGRNLTDRGLRPSEIQFLFSNDLPEAVAIARQLFPTFDRLEVERQAVLVNMAFNMGLPRLEGFRRFRAAVSAGNWTEARAEMLDSKWARQVGERADRLAEQMLTGREV